MMIVESKKERNSFFKKKKAYEMRISEGSSDVCSSDLRHGEAYEVQLRIAVGRLAVGRLQVADQGAGAQRLLQFGIGQRTWGDVRTVAASRDREGGGFGDADESHHQPVRVGDRKSTRLNSSH